MRALTLGAILVIVVLSAVFIGTANAASSYKFNVIEKLGENDQQIIPLSYKDNGDGTSTLSAIVCGYDVEITSSIDEINTPAFDEKLKRDIGKLCDLK